MHNRGKVTQNHTIVSLQGADKEILNVIEKYIPNVCSFYCSECSQFLRNICVTEDHAGHFL